MLNYRLMGKISQKKEHKKSVTLAAISGAVNDGISKTGQAIKQHIGDMAVKGEYYEHYNHPLVVNVFTIKGTM